MTFQIKDFASITAGMINWLKANTTKVTDFNVGSVVRTMAESSAAEMEEMYLQFFVGIKEAIPVSVFTTFGFDATPAEAASGIVRFTAAGVVSATIVIPAGTVVRAPGDSTSYSTLAASSILVGQTYVDVLVAAQVAGFGGNKDAATVTEIVTAVSGVAAVTNPAPLINGRDAETDDERRIRFQGYIASLARGTSSAVEYGARTAKIINAQGVITEYVAHAGIFEPWLTDNTQPIAKVLCYIHNGAGATSAALVERAQKVVDGEFEADGITPVPGTGWKAAGVICEVAAASDIPVSVTGVINVLSGYDKPTVVADADSALRSYIQSLGVGKAVQRSEVVAIIKRDVLGVFNVTVSLPAADVAITPSQKAIPGTITLTAP